VPALEWLDRKIPVAAPAIDGADQSLTARIIPGILMTVMVRLRL